MEKDEDRYVRFKLSEEQLVDFTALLGPHEDVEQFLGKVEGWINEALWVSDKEQYAPVTLRQMIVRLDKYERICNKFVQEVRAIDADLSKPHLQVGAIDWPAILLIEGATLTDDDGNRHDFTDGFVSEVVESVRTLGVLCKLAKDSVPPPKKGDLSTYEIKLQRFEDGVVDAYKQTFGCYPAKTQGSAFYRAMNVFYRIAGYSVSNSHQRVGKAVDRCAEILGHNPTPE